MTSHRCFKTAAALAAALCGLATAAAPKPNLVFVFSDQQSWDMLGCYGNRDLKTPNLDALAAGGVRFTHCISQSPVCTPYRGMLFSGRHPLKSGALANDLQMQPTGGTGFAEVLRDAGYRVGYYGKWHLYGGDRVRGVPPGPLRYGFDHEFLINNCTLEFSAERAWYWSQDGSQKLLYGDWEPYAQTRQAIEFIERHRDRPFALFLSWHPPHDWPSPPVHYGAPEDCLALYDPARLTLRPTVHDTPRVRLIYQGHMAMISSLDRALGWLMETLDRHGLSDRTLVVFTSDHGDMLMSYNWPHNKGRAEHLSCRVPLILRWPGRLRPHVNESLVGTLDLMPTILGLLGLPIPPTADGRDLSGPILRAETDPREELALFYFPANWRGIYTHRYTYSFSLGPSDAPQRASIYDVLYDRETDPWETTNLFASAAHADIKRDLHQRALALMRRYGDEGWHWRDLLECVRPEDRPAYLTAPAQRPKGWEGRLLGPPIDILRGRSRPIPPAEGL